MMTDRPASETTEEIEVTKPMVWAGLRALEAARGASDDYSLVREVYTAMRASAPRDLISEKHE